MVSIRDGVHSGSSPFEMVSIWDGVIRDGFHSGSCRSGIVFIRDLIQSGSCPFGMGPIWDGAYSPFGMVSFGIMFIRAMVRIPNKTRRSANRSWTRNNKQTTNIKLSGLGTYIKFSKTPITATPRRYSHRISWSKCTGVDVKWCLNISENFFALLDFCCFPATSFKVVSLNRKKIE